MLSNSIRIYIVLGTGKGIFVDYKKLAKEFFYKRYQLNQINHQQMLDKSLRGEICTLLYLKDRSEFVLPGEISGEMNISSARVASILNSLESKGLLERQIDKTDRRRILVSLTQRGGEKAEEHNEIVINMIAKMLELLGEDDAKEFVRITGRIIDMAHNVVEE